MAQQVIDIGNGANDGTGDTISVAGAKINNNFSDVYDFDVVNSDISFLDNTIRTKSSNADLVLLASGTGSIVFPAIRINDNNIEATRTNDDIRIIPHGTGKVTIANVGFSAGTTISSDDSSLININENLNVDGTLNVEGTLTSSGTISGGTGSTIGTLTLANGSITDSSGAISFGNETLSTTGTLTAGSGSTFGNLTFADGSITDSSGAISFGNENLSTSGNLNVTGLSTFGSMSANDGSSGQSSFVGSVPIDNITFNDNIITTSSNADLRLTPGGTGVVNISNLTIDSNLSLTDNVIKVTQSNANLEIKAAGTGKVQFGSIDLNGGSVDNVVIGGTTPGAGTFTALTIGDKTISSSGAIITDNTVKARLSNDNIEFTGSGSGTVVVNGFPMPASDGGTGQFLKTDGSKTLSFDTVPISFSESAILDAQNTIGFTTITEQTPSEAVGAHESITSTQSVIDEFDQSKYDSAWYHVLQRHSSTDSSIHFSTFKTPVLQGTEDGSTFDAFSGTSQIIKTQNNDAIITQATDVRTAVGKVRLLGQAGELSDSSLPGETALTFWRVGLGDNDSSGFSEGATSTIVVADLDSAAANLDTFAHASYRGAKYYISVNNTTTNEVQNSEVLVIHNGSDAFIQEYNTMVSNSANTSLATFTADISGSNVRLRGANGTAGTCRVTMYRILLADNESDSSGTYENIIGAQTVSNTESTTIDAHTFRGTASPDMSSQKVINSFAKTDFDSVWYHTISKDITNDEFVLKKLSLQHGVTSDGSTEDAFITDAFVNKTGVMNDVSTFDAGINGSNVELKATGVSDGSTTVQNAISYYAVGLGPNTTTGSSGNIGTNAGTTLGGNTETTIDHVTSSGQVTSLLASERSVDSFTASQYNGALYHVVTKDINGNSFETQKISVLHNFADGFVSSSAVVQTDPADDHPTFDADITATGDSTASVRLRATDADGSSVPSNTMAYYRIGIGDDDSTGYVGELGLVNDIMHVDIVDSSVTTLDAIAHGSHPAAKYFINVKNQGTGETSNIEALVTHDGTNAYITTYNEVFSGNNSLITLTADINGTSFRLRGSATAGGGTKVIVNRVVAFGDSESEEANSDSTRKIIGNTIVSSTATEFDSFPADVTDAVHYVITGQKGSAENFVCEASVVTDGTGVFVSQGPNVSSKSTDMLEITATISSGIVSVKASSTSGSSTVQAFAIRLKAPESQTTTIDSWASGSFRGAKYYISADDTINGHMTSMEVLVVHDGSDAYITTYNQHNSNNSLITLTADLDSSGNVRLLGVATTADVKVKFYRIRLADNESDSTGTDVNTIGAVTVSSTATAIDTFEHTSYTGAHYVIVGNNSSEGSASISEASVLTNGATAFVTHGPEVSTKTSNHLEVTATHDGSSTVTVKVSATSGGSTTVNAYRIHQVRGDAFSYDVIDTFAHANHQGVYYVIVGKNASDESQIAEVPVVTNGTSSFLLQEGANISTHSTTTPLMDFSTAVNGDNVELRAQNSQENTDTVVNMYKLQLSRAQGNPSSIATLDTFSATDFRSAKYTVSISDSASGDLGLYEVCDVAVVHDGSSAYVSVFGRTTNHTGDLVTFTADIDSGNVRLRGQISNTNTHTVTVVRKNINT
jgi:hypothetical protein